MTMIQLIPYNRRAAVNYAHEWAFRRNPAFYDFSQLGGDCTNFASQCLYAGVGVMNFTPEFGWYYISAELRAAAWTGVPFFWDFMTRQGPSASPFPSACFGPEISSRSGLRPAGRYLPILLWWYR